MSLTKWIVSCTLVAGLLAGTQAMAAGQGKGKGHHKHDEDDQGESYYRDHDREVMRDWYERHGSDLPPGLAKKDRLPPGLEKQLVRRGTLPPGLQKRIQPCPPELERQLPPPPPDCAHVVVAGHIVLLNRRTNIILDIFHFEG